MELKIFLSCWGNELSLLDAISHAPGWGYHGVEGPLPADAVERKEAAAALAEKQIPYIAEIATGGDYVPAAGLTLRDHLDDLENKLEGSVTDFEPLFVNVLGGSDRWSFSECVDFFQRGIDLGRQFGHVISWETHRSRPTFNPWITRDLLLEIPEMRLNCDFSHWCAVCERLVLDEEPEILALCAERCQHLHARIGYDQGPQVPDPSDPYHASNLKAHLRWWQELYCVARDSGANTFTATPEFGPDGYLQLRPFTQEPVAPLIEVNRWMAAQLVEQLQ